MFRSHSMFVVRDSTLEFRKIEHATLEFHNAALKFDNTTLVFHATFQLRIFNFTPTIRYAQLLRYAKFHMLGCHFKLVSPFNSRHV